MPATLTDEQRATAAERQQRHRDRKKDGGATFVGELTGEQVRRLIEAGWVDPREVGNPRALGADLADIVDCHCRGVLRPPLPDREDD